MAIAGVVLIAGAAPDTGSEELYLLVGAAYVCAGIAAGAAYVCVGIAACAAGYDPDEPIIMVVTGATADVGVPAENVIVGGAMLEE